MAKLTLNTISSGFQSNDLLNTNFDDIETAIENTLSRDGTSPNTMSAQLDMNSNQIINLAAPTTANAAARKTDVDAVVAAGLPTQTTHSGKYLKTDGSAASWDALDISTADISGTLPIANGGTGATSASAVRTALSLVPGTDVQAYDADLTTWASVTPGTGVATALAINIGTTGSPVVNGGVLGTPSSGTLTNCTGLPVAGGGTGATTFTDAGVLIGNGTGAIQVTTAGTAGQVLTSNGAGVDPTFQAAGSTTAPVFSRVVLTSGDITTTSTTFVDLTGATITFTTGANPVAYGLFASGMNSTTGEAVILDVDIDGARQSGATNGFGLFKTPTGGALGNVSFTGQSAALSAGSHTIKVQWRVSANTGTISASSPAMLFWAHEIR